MAHCIALLYAPKTRWQNWCVLGWLNYDNTTLFIDITVCVYGATLSWMPSYSMPLRNWQTNLVSDTGFEKGWVWWWVYLAVGWGMGWVGCSHQQFIFSFTCWIFPFIVRVLRVNCQYTRVFPYNEGVWGCFGFFRIQDYIIFFMLCYRLKAPSTVTFQTRIFLPVTVINDSETSAWIKRRLNENCC